MPYRTAFYVIFVLVVSMKDKKLNINIYIKSKLMLLNIILILFNVFVLCYSAYYYFNKLKNDSSIICFDKEKPTINLNNEKLLFLNVNDTYIEYNITTNDDCDNNLNITISSNINEHNEGLYTVNYTVTDKSGNQANETRFVFITEENITSIDDYKNSISDYLENYKVSVGYYNLESNETFYYNKDQVYYGASLIKTLDALYMYENNLVTEEIDKNIEKAITVSDNEAHTYLINKIGFDNLKEFGTNLGMKYVLKGYDNYGSTTIDDQIILFKELYSYTSNNDVEKFKNYFINEACHLTKLENVISMHKYGEYDSNYHDVAIFLDDSPYILAVLSNGYYYVNNPELYYDISLKFYYLNILLNI